MQITVQFEAQLREVAGFGERSMEVTDGCSLLHLLQDATVTSPALRARVLGDDGQIQSSLLLFVNDVPESTGTTASVVLKDGDKVLLLPPISGG